MPDLDYLHFKKPPIMFAAWPGMGNAGLMAMDYLRRHIDAQLFAELDMEPFYVPEEVVVENGIARFPEIPKSFFHEQHNPDMVIFESTVQMRGKDAVAIAQTVLDVAHKLKAPRVITAAALPRPMSHETEPQVYAASNQDKLLKELERYGIEPLQGGYISGLNGLLLGIAASKDIEAACILASIPSYATGIPYPKGSLAIVRKIAKIMNISIDETELEDAINESESTFADIEERLQNILPLLEMEEDGEAVTEEEEASPGGKQEPEQRVPEYAMERIEKLFDEVKRNHDKKRAKELKNELDRWGLYQLYENRFLDLFK